MYVKFYLSFCFEEPKNREGTMAQGAFASAISYKPLKLK